MAAPKKPAVKLNTGLLSKIREGEKERENARENRLKAFQAEDGRTLMLNLLMARVANSYKPTRPAGRGTGEVPNEDFQKNDPGRGWTAADLYGDLPEDWKFLTQEDVENRLLGIWEDEGGEDDGKGNITNPDDALIHKNKVARYTVFRLNIEALEKLEEGEEEEPEEK